MEPVTNNSIDLKVIQLYKSSSEISIENFGGVGLLYNSIDDLKESKFISDIVVAIINSFNELKSSERQKAEKIIKLILEICDDEFAIQEILDSILDLDDKFKNTCFKICLNQALNEEKKSIVRSWYLEISYRLVLLDFSKRHIFIGTILETATDDCPQYLRHVSKISGSVYSNWQELDILEKLLEIKDAHLLVDETWYELGMSYLQIALNAEDHRTAMYNFCNAKDHFKRTLELSDEKLDAEAYYKTLLILTSFPDVDNSLDYQKLLEEIKSAIMIYYAWHSSNEDTVWLKARQIEIVNWFTLIDKLQHLLVHIKEPTWFEPKVVIETYLLNIYTASRTILKRTNEGGIEKLIQPIINNSLAQNTSKLFLLDKWLETEKSNELLLLGKQLKDKLNNWKANYQDDVIYDFENLSAEIPFQCKNSLEQFICDCNSLSYSDLNPVIEQILNRTLKDVESNSSYGIDKVKKGFHMVLNQAVTFLESRMNGTVRDNKRMAYLYESNTRPLESALQEDFHDYLLGNLINAGVTVEKSNIAGGRIDVNISFGSFNFSVEIKRDWKDCSFELLKSKYLGQAAEYLNTDVKIGFLMVLDLTDKSSGIRSIESCIKVEVVKKVNDPVERAIVVLVVPGNRKTPSKINLE